MDHEFRSNEMSAADAVEKKYFSWLDEVGVLLGRFVQLNSFEESELFDYYSNGLTPEEAHAEFIVEG